jgi:hypothetical protein
LGGFWVMEDALILCGNEVAKLVSLGKGGAHQVKKRVAGLVNRPYLLPELVQKKEAITASGIFCSCPSAPEGSNRRPSVRILKDTAGRI